jgi:PPOX class probable F420-dependent enzyme
MKEERIAAPMQPMSPSRLGLLGKPGFAHLATISGDGSPHSTPMWYAWDGRHLLFSTLKARQKYRNVLRDRRVSVSIADPDDAYCYLQIQGLATPEDDVDGELLSALTHRYLGNGVSAWDGSGAERAILKVEPRRVTCFGRGPDAR